MIDEVVAGERLRGRYAIPASIAAFPQSLAAEAVGQLAAWAAMADLDFELRPVAGLAQELVFHEACKPGDTLQLDVALESITAEAISYSGAAQVDGRPVLELRHSVGPMLPMDEFDDPQAVRADHALLLGGGRRAGAFPGIDAPLGELLQHEPGKSIEARLVVPAEAPFFADHFPRRPVFPATLLMNALTHWAVELGGGVSACRLASVANVKMRSWILPGQVVELRVEGATAEDGSMQAKLAARSGDKTVATARATLARRAS